MRVKICGLTSLADTLVAIEAGADAVGFNFFPGSKRYLERVAATGWLEQVPASVTRVAVMVDPTLPEALAVAALPYIDGLQLHGAETPAFCAALEKAGVKFGKALPVSDCGLTIAPTGFATRTIVLDAQSAGEFGGTGRTFPWPVAQELVTKHPELRFVLAGGLAPENVARAIALVRPFGVDVTTGVEFAPGRKDHGQLRAFLAAAHSA